MKIYTKTGDEGKTSLLGGQRVDKDHFRIEAYGTVDELNSFIGLLISKLSEEQEVQELLARVQDNLFVIGSYLACPTESKYQAALIAEPEILALERAIDLYDQKLEPLKNFILPGGDSSSSLAHICRTICRRSERRVVGFEKHGQKVEKVVIRYLNRLSDYFFVLARKINNDHNVKEIVWRSNS